MNWKERIFKPRWQHRKEHIRAEAVSNSNDPRIYAALNDIAANDESPLVRHNAIARLTSMDGLWSLHKSEADENNRVFIHRRICTLLVSPLDAGPGVESRITFLQHWDHDETLERIASNADDAGLRLAALKKVNRQGFLGDRAIKDSDAKIRQYAVGQLTQASTMERVEQALRTRDKQLYRELNEKLQQQRIAKGDAGVVNRSVERVLRQLDNLVKGANIGERRAQLGKIDTAWKEFQLHASAELKNRFETARAIIQNALDNPVSTVDPAERSRRTLSAAIRKLDRLTADSDFEHCKHAMEHLEAEIKEQLSAADEQFETAPLRHEFEKAQQHIGHHLSELAATQEVDAGLRNALNGITAIHEGSRVSRRKLNDLTRDWQKAWTAISQPNSREQTMNQLASETLARIETRVAASEQQQQDQLQAAVAVLDRMEQHLEDGALRNALADRAELQKILPAVRRDQAWKNGGFSDRLQDIQAKLRELRDWQHWSNNKIRSRLIEKVDQLLKADLNADAIVASVKDAQSRWKALESSEQIPGDKRFASSSSAWRRFNTACNKAFDQARPFLEKRTEFQQHRQHEMELLCTRLSEAIEAPDNDWKAIQRGMQKARTSMRHLDEIPARMRQKTARLLRDTMDAVSAALDGHNQEVEQTKRRLIREAQQIKHMEDSREAMDKAKALQREWQSAGTMWRSMDQKLWNEFREPIDPLFKAASNARAEEKQARQDQQAQFVTLCEQVENLGSLTGQELISQGGRIAGLEAEWRDLGAPGKAHTQRFTKAVKSFAAHLDEERENLLNQERERWQQKLELCQQLESKLQSGKAAGALLKKTRSGWQGDWDSDVDNLMDLRLEHISAACDDPGKSARLFANEKTDTDAAGALCLQLEFLAGLDSPPECSDARMTYQVDRLSQTLGDASTRLPVMAELHEIETRWYSLGPLASSELTALQHRFNQGISEIVKQSI